MEYSWILLAVLAGLSSQIFNFLNRYLLKDGEDPLSLGWISEFLRFFIYFLFLPIDFQIQNSVLTYVLLIGLGFVNLLSVYVFFRMHSFAELSISSIVSRIRIIWVPIIAFIFLGEVLNFNQYLGIAILFIGLSVAVSPNRFFADKGVFYSFITSIVVAIISVLFKALSPLASTSVIMVVMALPSVILLPLLMKNSIKRLRGGIKDRLTLKILASLANLLAMYFTLMSLKSGGPVSIVSGIYQAMMIISVIAGIIFLKERKDIPKKLIGSTITVIGIILIASF
jgi:drug/metabolite transporter (DMT)-like permease